MVKRVPRYMIIKEKIMDEIYKNGIVKNGRLPSEDELANYFCVSRTTVRSALQALESEGVVLKKHGSGNFVRLHGKYPSWNSTFAILFYDDNAEPEFKKHQIRYINISEYIANKLNIEIGTKGLEVFKLMHNKGNEAICIVETFPKKLIKKEPIAEEIPDSIYDFTIRYCDTEVKEISSDILAIPACESPFKQSERPVVKLEEVFLDGTSQPIAYSNYYMNIENVRPHVIRNKPPLSWKIF